MDFVENSSLVKRLRAIIFSVILLIIAGFAGLILTNRPFARGLQDMNAANLTMTSITNCLETLSTSDSELDNYFKAPKSRDSRYIFFESQKLFKLNLDSALQNSSQFPAVHKRLKAAQQIKLEFEKASMDIFGIRNSTKEELQADILVAHQFAADIQENLRAASISMKKHSDMIFNEIYRGRFKPIIMLIIISSFYIAFITIFGFSIMERLKKSLQNLVKATEEISAGDITYRAKILHHDEFGKVTHAFNEMISSLAELRFKNQLSTERITLLQSITAAFSEALTPDQVFDIIIDKGFKALAAHAGIIATISRQGNQIDICRMVGFPTIDLESRDLIKSSPLTDATRFGIPLFFETVKELHERYPHIGQETLTVAKSTAILPLKVGSEILGALAFNFDEERPFSDEEKQFMIALARQSAQALHRSQLFEDAKKAIQARNEFLSIASHELRTPLTPLKLQLQGLERKVVREHLDVVPVSDIWKIIDNSDKQITRLARLIEDLLDVSRIQAGHLTLNKEKVNLSEMIEEVVKHYSGQLKNSLSTIQLKIDPTIEGYMDRIRIEQVLINFITNAAKYAPGKPVTIELTRMDNHAQIVVKDEGPGISPRDQERIFDRFERVKAKDNIGGLGLGLYISKQIIDAHGGDIKVESKPGEGASFIVILPLKEHPLQ